MSSSKFVGQLKQNNKQINNLKALLSQNEKHMTDHEQELTDKVDDFMEYQNYELKKHTENINNPHHVTKEQIGLGNVDNVQQASKAEFNEHNNDAIRHITDAERVNWNAAEKNAKAYTDELAARRDNPNQVTKEQVGLSNVTNDKQATKIEFDTHVKDSKIHITDAERSKWNAAQLSKLTQDNGLINNLSGTDFNTVIESGFYYMTSASTTLNAPVNSNGYLLVYNYGTYPYQEFTSYSGITNSIPENRRKFIRNKVSGTENWTPWMEIEYSDGAQAKVNTHASDSVVHVNSAERAKWNGAQLFKITNDAGGALISIADTDDFLERIVKAGKTFGTFYSTGKPINAPSTLSTRGYFHFTSTDANGNGTFGYVIAIDYKNNLYTNYVDGNLGWAGWRRLTSNAEFENIAWQNVTLKNGAATGDRPFQYAKWGKVLLLRGHITATREVVCGTIPSAGLPVKGATAMISVSGTTGDSKLLIFANGELKLTGIHSNDDNAVTGYYMDAVIPLE
ncbi:pyocin knob domain-containing protein [Bacillus subtilis]|uniref:pyocin knob domain-containing protein n=1 Tax=Bacillus subtilis TaxID=1423 RepID=UPI0031F48FC3